MPASPLYTAQSIEHPAYQLRYTWTGWPSTGHSFHSFPPEDVLAGLRELWEQDGIRMLESVWQTDQIQLTCSVTPTVSPVLFTSRIKGRLQHALRKSNYDTSFSRKVAFRSIGETTRKQIEQYIAKQVSKEQFVDDSFAAMVAQFTVHQPESRLDEAIHTNSGRYWYNLHVVIVTDS